MSEASSNAANPQRWWEGYLVRYFLGFIVGIICIITIGIQTILNLENESIEKISIPIGNQSAQNIELGFTPIAIALALLGIAYCYIASTPITVLHSTRMMKTWFHRHSRSFWMAWSLTLAFRSLLSLAYIDYAGTVLWLWLGLLISSSLLSLSSQIFGTLGINDRIKGRQLAYNIILGSSTILFGQAIIKSYLDINISLVVFSLPVLWILFGQYWTLFALLRNDNDEFLLFYKKISKARQKPGSRDIRDSYTHLREHANSVFVVLIELCILAGLLALHQTQLGFMSSKDPINIEIAYWNSILILTGVWLVPTVFMWSLANRLEKTFADQSADFIEPPSTP